MYTTPSRTGKINHIQTIASSYWLIDNHNLPLQITESMRPVIYKLLPSKFLSTKSITAISAVPPNPPPMDSAQCSTVYEGDNDIYGNISYPLSMADSDTSRLRCTPGFFYFQMLSVCISSALQKSSETGALTSAIWFQVALLVALINKTSSSTPESPIYPVEFFIVIQLLQVLDIPWVLTWKINQTITEFSTLTFIVRYFVLPLWTLTYDTWFWWRGMDVMFADIAKSAASDPSRDCSETSKLVFFGLQKSR